ncbi:MAG TPA: coagulation factor 5/8 type domain-containing protein [Polyangiaceae bacterium]|jgi:hypothetical protein|nr:coagulation factor 5/8 type domain-containing protein [Polyangiaceae bacterium]
MQKHPFLFQCSIAYLISACGLSPSNAGSPAAGAGAAGAGGSSSSSAGSSAITSGAGGGNAAGGAGASGAPTGGAPSGGAGGSMAGSSGAAGVGSGVIVGWPPADAAAVPAPDFGPNVLIFDPSTPAATTQSQLDKISAMQNAPTDQTPVGFGYGAEYSTARYAYFFKPGQYNADVNVGFYVQALGLGHSPDDVTINGAVRVKADWRTDDPGDALLSFWRGAENIAVVPTLASDNMIDIWAVSQATHLRRMHIKGSLALSDGGYSSGGFIADSKIDTKISSGSQQQFFTRNTDLTNWQGGAWNMVFVGDGQPATGTWPNAPDTVVNATPVIREKPFMFIEPNGNYYVMVPSLKANSTGPDWTNGSAPGNSVPISQFYFAHPGTDTAATINAALAQGKHLLLLPGIYHLTDSIQITNPNTIVLGLGIPTLIPDKPIAPIVVADVDGVTLAGLMVDAGPMSSPTLIQFGPTGSTADHSQNPSALFDVHCRIGGAEAGTAASCFTINSNNVLIDNTWLWRSDDGAGVSWDGNKSNNGLIVNGNGVTAYGLFVEHFQQFQTLWNGNGGATYFYQSELPYDVPTQSDWQHDGINGYASYKIGDNVTSHDARGLGVYCVFDNAITSANAVETPTAANVKIQHIVTLRFGGANGSGINHIINGTGNAVNSNAMSARSAN